MCVRAAGRLPLALHVGRGPVPVQHGVVAGLVYPQAVQLDGLGPVLLGEGIVGLLLHPLQVWGQLNTPGDQAVIIIIIIFCLFIIILIKKQDSYSAESSSLLHTT